MLKAKRLAAELDRTHPDAAGSLREGLDEMFTVRRLGIDGTLAKTLVCTNIIESAFDIVRTKTRNVKRWRDDGDMRRRWAAAGPAESRTTIPQSPRLQATTRPNNRPRPAHQRQCHTHLQH